jgi:predicted ABC-type ATPase
MTTKRMRVFAGPNGSGKTTIVNELRKKISYGVYVNADDIEIELRETRLLKFDNYQLHVTQDEVQNFFKESTFSPIKRNESELYKSLLVINNILHTHTNIDSYLAADIAEFIRQRLLANGESFTYETVMSHTNKIDFMQKAKYSGYRVYLYFIATEAPEINISRVELRVTQKGHNVSPEVVINRYYRSLKNLRSAVSKSSRAYFWDNSGEFALYIAEVTDGVDVRIIDTKNVPNWFVSYLIDKE